MIKEAIYKLINHKDLTYEESLAVMGEMMDGTATQAQMGGFLTALRMQGETIDEITAFATVMREKGVKLHPERDVTTKILHRLWLRFFPILVLLAAWRSAAMTDWMRLP